MNWKLYHWKNRLISAAIDVASGVAVLLTLGLTGDSRWSPIWWHCNWSERCLRRAMKIRKAERTAITVKRGW